MPPAGYDCKLCGPSMNYPEDATHVAASIDSPSIFVYLFCLRRLILNDIPM